MQYSLCAFQEPPILKRKRTDGTGYHGTSDSYSGDATASSSPANIDITAIMAELKSMNQSFLSLQKSVKEGNATRDGLLVQKSAEAAVKAYEEAELKAKDGRKRKKLSPPGDYYRDHLRQNQIAQEKKDEFEVGSLLFLKYGVLIQFATSFAGLDRGISRSTPESF